MVGLRYWSQRLLLTSEGVVEVKPVVKIQACIIDCKSRNQGMRLELLKS
jgi:hypothetical protein